MSVEQVLLVLLAAIVVGFVLLMLGIRARVRAEELALREAGCYCQAGRDGFHLPGCPVGDVAAPPWLRQELEQ